MLWADTFNNHFHPEVAKAAVEVLEREGFRVAVSPAASSAVAGRFTILACSMKQNSA